MTARVSTKKRMASKFNFNNSIKLLNNPFSLERRLHTTRNSDGIYPAIRYALLCSRLLGLLPLSGLWSPTSDQLRFTIRTPYSVYYAAGMFGQSLVFVVAFVWLLQNGISLKNFSNFVFIFSSLTSSVLLLNIARNLPEVIMSIEVIEATLPPFRSNNTKICNITIALVLMGALVEHCLSISYGYSVALSCDDNDAIETYFRGMPWTFQYTTYSLWKGLILEILSIQSTFIWSFNDLLIMVLSIYLTEHLVIHNALLKKAVSQEHFSAMEFRIQYLNVVRLIKLINGQVGIYILTSFGTNLYWICTQLFNSLNKSETGYFETCYDAHGITKNTTENEMLHAFYFTFSFSFVVLRTLLVLLLASRIHSNSKVPLVYLYALSTEKFDVEVERFIAQINNIKVALSGLDFFYVTRTMILTLLGTITTYELVMLQFNNLPSTLFNKQKPKET